MSIIFAAAVSHAPGWVAWRERAPEEQRDALGAAAAKLKAELETLRPDTIICLTSEHWTNFFLDHVSAFCVGLGESAVGPVDDDTTPKVIQRFYDRGIHPDWWKLEPFTSRTAWDRAAEAITKKVVTPAVTPPGVNSCGAGCQGNRSGND